ncbi:MAG: DNA replication and repair protein RecF [Treponema sp.]|nr:DNA replication and repair protein RecF [Treponema sp.]MCL2251806.1 DNA replication and repair protein RecF [Treponema sp.]
MFFSSLRTASFRNLEDTEFFTGAKDVFLIGENGQGKSNFLEALYFCAYASSFRTARDSELARNGEKDFSAKVNISQSVNDEILIKFEKGKKAIFINGKHTEDRKELLSIAPCIVFCHEDMEFVNGTPERRRWFFDQTLSLYDPVYLEDLRRYKRILKSRNTLLRDYAQKKTTGSIESVLDALDPQFAMYGLKLIEKREKAVKEFSDIFSTLYEEVSGISGITVQYSQSWKGGTTENDILSLLQQRRAGDMATGQSLCGPHRDRYTFAHNGTDFTIKASTGQRRLLALLLRAAQARRFSTMTGLNPLLLLDDVLLEMDGEKRRRFLSVLPCYDQAFYTFLPEEPYQRYQKEDTLVYTVQGGKLIH